MVSSSQMRAVVTAVGWKAAAMLEMKRSRKTAVGVEVVEAGGRERFEGTMVVFEAAAVAVVAVGGADMLDTLTSCPLDLSKRCEEPTGCLPEVYLE